jgi:hypothetical protein
MIRGLGIVTVVAFLLVSFTPLPNVLNQWAGVAAQLQPAAAIVVLGGGMDGDEVLRAYPKSSAARKVIQAHAKWSNAR